jgi:hypothetical protein
MSRDFTNSPTSKIFLKTQKISRKKSKSPFLNHNAESVQKIVFGKRNYLDQLEVAGILS